MHPANHTDFQEAKVRSAGLEPCTCPPLHHSSRLQFEYIQLLQLFSCIQMYVMRGCECCTFVRWRDGNLHDFSQCTVEPSCHSARAQSLTQRQLCTSRRTENSSSHRQACADASGCYRVVTMCTPLTALPCHAGRSEQSSQHTPQQRHQSDVATCN